MKAVRVPETMETNCWRSEIGRLMSCDLPLAIKCGLELSWKLMKLNWLLQCGVLQFPQIFEVCSL